MWSDCTVIWTYACIEKLINWLWGILVLRNNSTWVCWFQYRINNLIGAFYMKHPSYYPEEHLVSCSINGQEAMNSIYSYSSLHNCNFRLTAILNYITSYTIRSQSLWMCWNIDICLRRNKNIELNNLCCLLFY